jgi:hypothetical protein
MARTALTEQTVTSSGLEATYTAANADGNKFNNTSRTLFHVKNASVGDVTLTFNTPGTVDGLAVGERTVVCSAGEERFWRGQPSIYNQPSTDAGMVYVDYSAVTDVTVAVLVI